MLILDAFSGGISRDEAVNTLDNSVLEEKGVLLMDLGANKTPAEVIREGAFGGTYFRDIYSSVTEKWYRNSWREFHQLKDIDLKYYCSSNYDVSVNKYGLKFETSFRFWENKGLINKIDPYGWFQWYLDTGWVGKWKIVKDKLIDGKKL